MQTSALRDTGAESRLSRGQLQGERRSRELSVRSPQHRGDGLVAETSAEEADRCLLLEKMNCLRSCGIVEVEQKADCLRGN